MITIKQGFILSYCEVSAWGKVIVDKEIFKFHATDFWSRRLGKPKPYEIMEVLFQNDQLWEVRRPFAPQH